MSSLHQIKNAGVCLLLLMAFAFLFILVEHKAVTPEKKSHSNATATTSTPQCRNVSYNKRKHLLRTAAILTKFQNAVQTQDENQLDVNELIDIPQDAFAILPPLRRDSIAIYLSNLSDVATSLLSKGRLIEKHYLLLPIKAADGLLSELSDNDIVLPVFGSGTDKFFLTETVIVRFRDNVTDDQITEIMNSTGATSNKALRGPKNLYSFDFPQEAIPQIPSISWALANNPNIIYSEPNWLGLLKCSTPDPFFGQQWALENTEQTLSDPVTGMIYDSDVDASDAWAISKGSSNTFVAVCDDGVEWDHPDLADNMAPSKTWFDAIDGDSDPRPQIGDYHGTSIAGIIAAVQNNGIGTCGVAPDCKIMPVRIAHGSSGEWVMETEWAVNGIGWAWQNGASVLNFSWGMGYSPITLEDAISTALSSGRAGKGCVIIAAAGNSDGDIGDFPANMHELLTVGASSPADERKSPTSVDGENWGSNYGSALDCVAPGVKIYTTDNTGMDGKSTTDYNPRFNGTSAAAPFAAGIAAMVLSLDQTLTQEEVSAILCTSAERVGNYSYSEIKDYGLWYLEMGYGRLNAHHALAMTQGDDYELPEITHTPLSGQTTTGPFVITANMTDNSGIDTSEIAPRLCFKIGESAWVEINDLDGPDGVTYSFSIPYVPFGSTVSYYLMAQDQSPQHNMVTLPFGGSGLSSDERIHPSNLFAFIVDQSAGIVTVNDNGPAQYASIQSAIDSANYGDVIKVAGGTYQENLNLTERHGITISGGYSEDFEYRSCKDYPSVIDGRNTLTALSFFSCNDTSFDGFSIINGKGSFVYGAALWAGGFIVKDGSGMQLSHLHISKCSAYTGSGGVIYGANNFNLSHCRFTQNENPASACVYVKESQPTISYIEITRNEGSALKFYYAGGVIRNATIVDNIAPGHAYCVGVASFPGWPDAIEPTIKYSIIKYNYAYNGEKETNINPYQFASVVGCVYSRETGSPYPSFLNRQASIYNLRAGSIGVDSAADLGIKEDVDGLSVPWGPQPDVGAHEYKPDVDGDGLIDTNEVDQLLTDPTNKDSDGDGMPDGWEISNKLNPLLKDGTIDSDGDLVNNFEEYIAGTIITNSESFFRVKSCSNLAEKRELDIKWEGALGRLYTIYYTTNLISSDWGSTSIRNIKGVDKTMSCKIMTTPQKSRFYKLEVKLEPGY